MRPVRTLTDRETENLLAMLAEIFPPPTAFDELNIANQLKRNSELLQAMAFLDIRFVKAGYSYRGQLHDASYKRILRWLNTIDGRNYNSWRLRGDRMGWRRLVPVSETVTEAQ